MSSIDHPVFDCYQRAHQNTLEFLPFFLVLILAAGLRHPVVAIIVGVCWIVARIIYSIGYYTGKPNKRIPGSLLSFFALLALFGTTLSSAAGLLGWW
jgi:glutathione S-transferase